jgi:phosphoribosylaminoimidazole-succinocarboxamide synthase
MASSTVSETAFPDLELIHRGKVRDVYAVGDDQLLLVATDRISAFDCILPTPIERKGEVLTAMSVFWFEKLGGIVENHLVNSDFDQMPETVRRHPELAGRSVLVKRTRVFPVECVVRGYLEGSGWKDYQATGEVCGHQLPAGMRQCDRLPEPLFTPATKAAAGHDENIDEMRFADTVGSGTAAKLKEYSLAIYNAAAEYALGRGIIIADTKFEFGLDRDGRIILIDEVLTPDSSRFWDAAKYEPGHAQASFDKQFVREYLETLDWDKTPPAPALPPEIAQKTTERYISAYNILTGREFKRDQ